MTRVVVVSRSTTPDGLVVLHCRPAVVQSCREAEPREIAACLRQEVGPVVSIVYEGPDGWRPGLWHLTQQRLVPLGRA